MPLTILAREAPSVRYEDELGAVVVLLLTALAVLLVHRVLAQRARELATAVAGGQLRPEATTRLRFSTRVIDVVIVVAGLSIALRPFAAVGDVASTILTSGAIAAAVVGFAARQTLANAIAGILLAVTQPLRIGDLVVFEGETGTVEDVRLMSTWLHTASGARVIVPNERLVAGVLRNDSITAETMGVEPSVWLNREVDPLAAVDALRAGLGDEVGVRLAETSAEGTRLLLVGRPTSPQERLGEEHALRERALRVLREAGVEDGPGGGAPADVEGDVRRSV